MNKKQITLYTFALLSIFAGCFIILEVSGIKLFFGIILLMWGNNINTKLDR